jgi:hypothetical protein
MPTDQENVKGLFDKPLMPRKLFLRRLSMNFAISMSLGAFSLAFGMLGYSYLEHLSLVDAFLNASMLLGGMGPVTMPLTKWGKIFAGFYALYSGVIFLVGASIVLGPIAHRFLHKFHLDDGDEK